MKGGIFTACGTGDEEIICYGAVGASGVVHPRLFCGDLLLSYPVGCHVSLFEWGALGDQIAERGEVDGEISSSGV